MNRKEVNSYKIGKTAKLAGVNKETIRYYERRNLISKPDRMDFGYRCFPSDISIRSGLLNGHRNWDLHFPKLKIY